MSASKTFLFEDDLEGATARNLQVVIPEVLDPSYGMYVWPCAAVLAQYIWIHRQEIKGKRVLEIGAGTSLPGVTAAKLGATVTLSDDLCQPRCEDNALRSCEANGLENVAFTGISWGYITSSMIDLPPVDILLASDCFYDSKDFEDVLATTKFFLEQNSQCQCWVTYQQRSLRRSIEHLLQKWDLSCLHVPLASFNADTDDIGRSGLPGNHTIEMLIITEGRDDSVD